MSPEQLINEFQGKLDLLAWKKDQEELAEMIRLQQEYAKQPYYANYPYIGPEPDLDKKLSLTLKLQQKQNTLSVNPTQIYLVLVEKNQKIALTRKSIKRNDPNQSSVFYRHEYQIDYTFPSTKLDNIALHFGRESILINNQPMHIQDFQFKKTSEWSSCNEAND